MKTNIKIALLVSLLILTGIFSFKLLSTDWKINQLEAKVSWTMPMGDHSGTISGLDAKITFDPAEAEKGLIKATVEVKSIDAGNAKLNNHLLTADFFDATNHPLITFTAEKITKNDSGFVATGKLSIRDSIHTIDVPFKFLNGDKQSKLIGTMDIFSGDYGVGKKSSTGKDRVLITIEVPMIKE